MENTPLHLGVLWYNSCISYLSPLRLPLPTSNKCNVNCCIILLFGGSMEKSSLVQSLLFSITLPCPRALVVRPVWRSGSCSRKKKAPVRLCVRAWLSVTVPTQAANHSSNTASVFSHKHWPQGGTHWEKCIRVHAFMWGCAIIKQ